VDAVDIGRILARRWYLTVVLFVMLAVGVVSIAGQVDPTYESSTDVLLLTPGVNPADPDLVDARNFFGAQVALGSAGISLARSDQKLSELVENGYSTDFTITGDREGSIYQIVVEADSPEGAQDSVDAVTEVFSESLAQVQADAGVPDQLFMDIQQIRAPSLPTKLTGDLRKLQAGATGIGTILIVVLVLSANAVIERRERRRQADDVDREPTELPTASDRQTETQEPPRRWGT
jgi:capsular polysaccharide biosynthesis protein